MRTRLLFISILVLMANFSMYAQPLLRQPSDPNETCQKAWQDYRKADVLWKTGWGLFGAGAGMTIAGCVAWTTTNHSWEGSTWTNPGFSIMCIGGGTFLASVPCLAIGQVRRKAAIKMHDEYNCLPATCEEIKNSYKKANTLWKTGWGLFGAGTGLMLAGCIGWRCTMQGGRPPEEQDPGRTALNTAFLSIMIIGSGATIASIPCLAVGQTRRKAAQNYYQKNRPAEPPLTFAIQTSSNGLGIAMKF